MPTRALRPYAYVRQIETKKIDERRADDPIRKLYKTATWRATRSLVLFRDQTCKACNKYQSSTVHHVISARKHIASHGNDLSYFFDESNLEGICKPCHDSKTAKEVGWAGR